MALVVIAVTVGLLPQAGRANAGYRGSCSGVEVWTAIGKKTVCIHGDEQIVYRDRPPRKSSRHLALTAASGSPPSKPGGIFSLAGQVGNVKLGVSTETDIATALGPPEATAEDNFQFPSAPEYKAFGYGCQHAASRSRRTLTYYPSGGPYCETVYYVNLTAGVLGSFWTSLPRFHTPRGTHVGVPQRTASRREHRVATGGCHTGILERSPAAQIFISIVGGSLRASRGNQPYRVIGGRVSEFAIDANADGVGILFC
jgi:hypothetical protein